jgi:hypothetical protein
MSWQRLRGYYPKHNSMVMSCANNLQRLAARVTALENGISLPAGKNLQLIRRPHSRFNLFYENLDSRLSALERNKVLSPLDLSIWRDVP